VNFLSQEHPQSRGQQGYFDRQGSHLHPSYTDVNKDAAYPPTAAQDRSAVPDGGVGQSLMHRNADAQVTGETKYVNDMPSLRNALHGYFVMSTRAHARLVRVDTSDAELCVGYASYLSARDIPGDNRMGTIVLDEELFATDRVIHYGQVQSFVLALC
jgi:xanthine dehydrogenase/oxidase